MEKENVLLLILIILLFVLYYFSGCKSETFSGDLKPEQKDNCVTLMVFLTKHCPHCVNHDKHHHDNLVKKLSHHNINVKKVYADEDDDNLFDKHEIMFVPAAMVMKGDTVAKVNGPITHENVMHTAKSMM